jgi:prolyl-tRNA synthetase
MEGLLPKLETLLETIQDDLLANARKRMEDNTHIANDFKEYKKAVKTGGFYKIHWCGRNDCENYIQERSKSTIRCIPLDAEPEEGECIVCQKPSERRVIAAQAY